MEGIARIGRYTIDLTEQMGRMMLFVLSSFAWLTRPPFRVYQIVKQLNFIGYKSTFVVVLTAVFTGMVLALQGHYTRGKRENTMEIGIMRITEQIDALDTMAINPLQYLIGPKLVASLIAVPLLVALFDVVGIYGGYVVGVQLLNGNEGAYWSSIESAVEWKDVYGGILKSISFGLLISWVCCYKGFHTRQSAEGLGTATTEAVVLSAVLILVWDYFLKSVLL